MPNQIIIADTSVLIALSNIDRIEILKNLYQKVTITDEILKELGESVPSWISVESVEDVQKIELLELELDKGESSAIALALEHENSLLIIDERKGRSIARKMGIKIIGLLGVIIKAKEMEIIDSIKQIIEELEHVGFRISKKLKNQILKEFDK